MSPSTAKDSTVSFYDIIWNHITELSIDMKMCESRDIWRWYKTALMICTFLYVTSEQTHNHYTMASGLKLIWDEVGE